MHLGRFNNLMSKVKNLLIIGGTGFIGKHLTLAAIQKGYTTTIISLNKMKNDRRIDGANYLVADVSNYASLEDVLENSSYSHVVNLGGYINHAKYKEGGREVFDAHFIGVQNLVSLLDWECLNSFVQIGSSDEYGDTTAPQSENNSVKPISPYSAGKVAASMLLQMLHRTENFPAIILRLFLVYGPGQNEQRFLPQIIKGCLRNESFATSNGQQLRDFCYIDDVVKAIILALENSEVCGQVINIASGEAVKIRSIIQEVSNIIGSGTPKYGEIPYRFDENMTLYADITKSRQMLNWQPEVSLSDGLAITINSYMNNEKR